ncbi:Imidazole glycerol phosphate synthase hisHF (IGP synthase) (IGPS) (ImGP synthase) [Includes: Glutaminase, partial [Durusdinium trenchii]
GADKISIGSDAVEVARAFYAAGRKGDGSSSIELISTKYGRQAVVISVDPRRVYVPDAAAAANHAVVELKEGTPKGPKGEGFAWYCCTVKGGREDSELDVVQLAQAVEALGAGELLLNCIDRDGQGTGYELELINQVKTACTLPVIASSGAGTPEHFEEALATGADAALAAGIFHREEVPIQKVKGYLTTTSIPVRS